ncbi:hypothetical protein GCK72_001398 [Caenorhabditis remanei]|uniref:Uncharacterized protein n=1 Tax=Caenorhabditis remanei TaxID=31234 RepID=E3MFJ0_CAERE|nr:hypothetical protein GCK72_001398 [Caenorhabditis remanei]EFP01065.1 hypothetical protein CRE_20714 [Caenorhabditis remanei]KAF1769581.1 hypothetical protein GCK72_001398 [Caenorhabditis remanei]
MGCCWPKITVTPPAPEDVDSSVQNSVPPQSPGRLQLPPSPPPQSSGSTTNTSPQRPQFRVQIPGCHWSTH